MTLTGRVGEIFSADLAHIHGCDGHCLPGAGIARHLRCEPFSLAVGATGPKHRVIPVRLRGWHAGILIGFSGRAFQEDRKHQLHDHEQGVHQHLDFRGALFLVAQCLKPESVGSCRHIAQALDSTAVQKMPA